MMKLVTRLLVLGAVFAAGMLVSRRQAARHLRAGAPRPALDLIPDADLVEEVVIIGLTDIDGFDPAMR